MFPVENNNNSDWTPDFSTHNQGVADYFQPSQEDFFAGQGSSIPPSLVERVKSPKELADTIYCEMEFGDNPLQAFLTEWNKITDSLIQREVLRELSTQPRFLLYYIAQKGAFFLTKGEELQILSTAIQNHFGLQSPEAIDFYLFAIQSTKENSIYLEALFICAKPTFLAKARELSMDTKTALSFAERLSQKDLAAANAFVEARSLDVVFWEGKVLLKDTKENIDLFLKALPSLRMEEKGALLLSKNSQTLEMLFGNLPYTQKNKKALNAFVVCVMARSIRGKPDLIWEKKAAKQSKAFRDNVYTASAVRYMEKVSEWKKRFLDEDISHMLDKVFYGEEDVKKRLPLLHTLTTLKVPELLSLPTPLSLEELENILRVRGEELLECSREESAILTELFSKWRAPLAVLRLCIAIDTLPEETRIKARTSLKNFLLHYAKGEYEVWRYEESPHLNAMREASILTELLDQWWRGSHPPEPFLEHFQLELTSDPADFLLTGEECGGCQRLDGEPRYIFPILGLMDGAFKMLVVRDLETGRMTSRAFVRWLTDKESGKGVLLVEPPYTFNFNPTHTKGMIDYLERLIAASGQSIPIVISPASLALFSVTERVRSYANPLHAEGLMAPKVFSDTYGISQGFNNEASTKTNGIYVLENIFEITNSK